MILKAILLTLPTIFVCAMLYGLIGHEKPRPADPTYQQGFRAGYDAALGKWRGAGLCHYANLACRVEITDAR